MSKYTGVTYEKTPKGQDSLDLVVDSPRPVFKSVPLLLLFLDSGS